MSSGQAPKRRDSSIIERSQYAPARPPEDDRRRKLEALGQDRAAIERAKQEIAEMSRQQGGRASAPLQLDDLEVQERKPLHVAVGAAPLLTPTSGADAPPQPVDDDMAMPDPLAPAVADHAVLPPAVATTKQVRAKKTQQPAVGMTKQVRAEAPATRTRFEYVEHSPARPGAPARSMPKEYPTAYPRDEHYAPQEVYPYWEAPIALARSQPFVLLLLAVLVCGPVIWMLSKRPETVISSYNGAGFSDTLSNVVNTMLGGGDIPASVFSTANVPVGEHSVVGAPSISADDVDAVLAEYNSPAHGTGQIWIELGKQYGIDPAYALAFFIHESSAGTNPRWDGMKPDGSTTHNIGNISCAGYPRCLGRWRDYGSWDEGIEDWYRLIRDEYVQGRGTLTVEQIMPIYAPSFENDVDTYVQTVVMLVDGWRRQGVAR